MKIFITAFILFISIVISSQSKKVDRINLLFGQENYRIVERKCNRIIKKEKLDESNIYSLYSSLSSYMLEDDLNYKKLIFSCNKTITILDENKIEFSIASINVSNYKHKIENDIALLKKKNKLDDANELFESYQKIFKSSSKSYANLIITEANKPITIVNESTIINYAKSYLGIPYLYGGNNRSGFDCSGFTKDVYLKYNRTLPRTAKDQSTYCDKIKFKNIKSGDLLFFGKSNNKISHVGIAIKHKGEELQMIHASSSNGIIISNVTSNSYWFPKFQFAGKIID
mgnify:CR=1 FL=1